MITSLKTAGFKTAALALNDDSVSIDHPDLISEEKLAIILGTEGDGLAASTIANCDYTVKITHGSRRRFIECRSRQRSCVLATWKALS